MKSFMNFIKVHSFTIFLFFLGLAIYILTSDYPEVPTGVGPAFFPRIVATILILFSILCVIINRNDKVDKSESNTKETNIKILSVIVSIVVLVFFMDYVHPIVGIALFLFAYNKWMAKLTWINTIIITAIGSGVIYILILILNIPL